SRKRSKVFEPQVPASHRSDSVATWKNRWGGGRLFGGVLSWGGRRTPHGGPAGPAAEAEKRGDLRGFADFELAALEGSDRNVVKLALLAFFGREGERLFGAGDLDPIAHPGESNAGHLGAVKVPDHQIDPAGLPAPGAA